ncbi:hypothetical protein ABW54_11630 [Burkholderia cenocepacia]|nr:hypothetical protein ABW54_11630 [Burkholderia cenocepacia]
MLFFVTAIVVAAGKLPVNGAEYLLFPELAALAYDAFTRPGGGWARAPLLLVITPTVTAVAGIAIMRVAPDRLVASFTAIGVGILLVRLLRSPIIPAISAGFLPVIFSVTSWGYPVAIAASTAGLAILILARQRLRPDTESIRAPLDVHPHGITDVLPDFIRTGIFACVIAALYAVAVLTGLNLILFPPLVVIAYEMLAHTPNHPWGARPYALLAASLIVAVVGTLAVMSLGIGFPSVALSLLAGAAALHVMKFHFPPALAIALLPQLMITPTWKFPLAVGIGITVVIVVHRLATHRA